MIMTHAFTVMLMSKVIVSDFWAAHALWFHPLSSWLLTLCWYFSELHCFTRKSGMMKHKSNTVLINTFWKKKKSHKNTLEEQPWAKNVQKKNIVWSPQLKKKKKLNPNMYDSIYILLDKNLILVILVKYPALMVSVQKHSGPLTNWWPLNI